jgi:hypothetical protein
MKIAYTVILLAALGLAACGGKPLHPSKYKEPAGEIPPGPGLLTGEDGAFVLERDF